MVKNFCPRKNEIGHYREFFSKKALHLKYVDSLKLMMNFKFYFQNNPFLRIKFLKPATGWRLTSANPVAFQLNLMACLIDFLLTLTTATRSDIL